MPSKIEIKIANTEEDFLQAKTLISEYIIWLGFDLAFQNIDKEMNDLRSMYSKPVGGLLLATVDGKAAGVAGIRKFEGDDCELKRMFVKEDFRGCGLGKELILRAIELAKDLKYRCIKLDTAEFMKDAISLYQSNGFVEIPAYRFNPHESARYFELPLRP